MKNSARVYVFPELENIGPSFQEVVVLFSSKLGQKFDFGSDFERNVFETL